MHAAPPRNAVAATTAVLVLSSCSMLTGDSEFLDTSPRTIAKAAFEEMRDVRSMRILGSTDTEAGLTRIDIRLDANNCVGSFDSDDGGFRLVKNSDGAWFNADDEFWRSQSTSRQQSDTLIAAFAGAWVRLDGKTDFDELCDLDSLLSNFKLDKGDTEDRIDGGEVEKVGDADAVAIDGREGKERTTVWIAVQLPHHVLKMAPINATGTEALFFEDFGVEVVAETPRECDIATIPGS